MSLLGFGNNIQYGGGFPAARERDSYFDDFFLVYEEVFPYFFGLGERYLFTGYAIMVLLYGLLWRKLLWKVGPHLLILSLTFFAIGMGVDVFFPSGEELQRLAEDGPKLIGISLWATFHLWAVWRLTAAA